MSINNAFWIQLYAIITLCFCGVVQYFTGILAVLWLPVIMAFATTGMLLIQTQRTPLALDLSEMMVLVIYLCFLVLALISTFLQGGVTVTIIGIKNEVGMSLVLFCLLLGFCRESQIYRISRVLYWIFYAQFPLVIYQVLIVLPKRVAMRGEDEKWDSVVGTFGGDPMGGGNTAVMGMFCLLIMLMKLSELKHGVTTWRSAALHIGLGFVLCILGEVKFIILLSPFMLALIWSMPSWVNGVSKVTLKNLLVIFAVMGGLITLAIMVLAAGYSSAFGGDAGKSSLSIFLDSLDYIFDTNYIMAATGELGRLTTIFFWARHSDMWGISSMLFGYGLNATNSGSAVSAGYLNIIFRLVLDSTSLSMLLWEVGIVGTTLFIGLLLWIVRITWPRPLLEISQLDKEDVQLLCYGPAFTVFIIACLLSLPYSQTLMIIPLLQFLFYLTSGSALVIRRAVHRSIRREYE